MSYQSVTSKIRYTIILAVVVLLCIYDVHEAHDLFLVAVVLFWCQNVIYCCENFYSRFLVFIFNGMIFLFILSRPVISLLRGDKWDHFSDSNINYSLTVVLVSLIAIFMGSVLAERLSAKGKPTLITFCDGWRGYGFLCILKKISFVVFVFSFIAYSAMQFEKLLFMEGRAYEEYYVDFQSTLPYVIYVISRFMKYSLCIFLATYPSKKVSLTLLIAYVLSEIPTLIIGMRGPIMLNCLFVFVYFVIREVMEGKGRWIGRAEKVGIAIAIPVVMVLLGFYNYARAGKNSGLSVFQLLVDFLYKQGVTYDVLNIGYTAIPDLPWHPFRNYTFGGFIDYFKHGFIAQKFFGASGLGANNSILMATEGNSFAHSMSYVAHDDYLDGGGWGSSYLLETYTDFGYIGVAIFSFVIGMALIYLYTWMRRGVFTRALSLVCLTNVFFIPRASALGWIEFILQAQFWACIGLVFIPALIISKLFIRRMRSNG